MRTKLYLAVDSAHFFLFHPDDCPDAAGQIAPPDEALAEGLVVGLRLGGDGTRAVEVTDEPTDADLADVASEPLVFPLDVRHGPLYATDRMASPAAYDWPNEVHADVSPGLYIARWYLLSDAGRERRNCNWLLTLEEVATIDDVPAWDDLPHEDDLRRIR